MTAILMGGKSKTLATWFALIGGSLGLHRFYLHGFGDLRGWLFPGPTLLGLYGVFRAREFGLDDRLSWLLIPVLGLTLAVGMLSAIVYGLTPDERWQQRHDPQGSVNRSGWMAAIGVILALAIGAGVLMAAIAFSAQRYFEYQAELSQPASR